MKIEEVVNDAEGMVAGGRKALICSFAVILLIGASAASSPLAAKTQHEQAATGAASSIPTSLEAIAAAPPAMFMSGGPDMFMSSSPDMFMSKDA